MQRAFGLFLTASTLACACLIHSVQPVRGEERSYADLVASIEAQNALIGQLLDERSFDQHPPTHAPCCQGCGERACCCPGWTAAADAVFWERSRADDGQLGQQQFAPNAIVLDNSDFDLGFEAGVRLTLTRHTRTGCDLELRYLGIDAWDDTIILNDSIFLLTGGGNFGLGVAPTTVHYVSELHSGELNVASPRRSWMRWLVGFRMLELSETFSGDAGTPDFFRTRTDNYLYGLQAGAVLTPVRTDRFQAQARLVGGAYYNNARVSGETVLITRATDQQRSLAFVGEVGLTAIYELTDHLALRAGYEVMLIDNVAGALEQVSTFDSVAGTITLVDDSSFFYHGGFGGLELTW